MTQLVVAVTAASFIKNPVLCAELVARAPGARVRFAKPEDVGDEAAMVRFLTDATVWIVGREPVTEAILRKLTLLKLIVKYGVGLDNVDLDACTRHQLPVVSRPGVNASQVAELTLGLMLCALRNIAKTSRLLKAGQWEKVGGVDLRGRTVGIVGCGHIGSRVMELVHAFGCPVLVCDLEDKSTIAARFEARQVSLEELGRTADVVSAHLPLTPLTANMFDRAFFERMKPGSVFINTARGEIVVEKDLQAVLEAGHLRAAACDVFRVEPPRDNALTRLDNFIGTPHIGGASVEAMLGMGRAAIDAVVQYFN